MQIGTQTLALGGAEKPTDGAAARPSRGDRGDSFAKAMLAPSKPHTSNDNSMQSEADRPRETGSEEHEAEASYGPTEHPSASYVSRRAAAPQSINMGEPSYHTGATSVPVGEMNLSEPGAKTQDPTSHELMAQSVGVMPEDVATIGESADAELLPQGSERLAPSDGVARPLLAGEWANVTEKAGTALDQNVAVTGRSTDPGQLTRLTSALNRQGAELNHGSALGIATVRGEGLVSTQPLSSEALGAIGKDIVDLSKFNDAVAGEKTPSEGFQALKSGQSTGAEANIRLALSGTVDSIVAEKKGDSLASAMVAPATQAEKTSTGAAARTSISVVGPMQTNIANRSISEEFPPRAGRDTVQLDVPAGVKPPGQTDNSIAHGHLSKGDNSQLLQPTVSLVNDVASVVGGGAEVVPDAPSDLILGELRGAETLAARAEISGHLRTELPRHIAVQLADIARTMPDRPVELTLSPEELGRLRLTFSGDLSAMTVTVNVERPETLELMRRHIDTLAREMQEIGYGDVSFTFEHSGSDHKNSSSDSSEAEVHVADGMTSEITELEQLAPVQLKIESGSGLDIRL